MAPGRSSDPSPEIAKTRLDAAETALRYLNVDDLSPVSLFNLAGEVLGLDRTERILTLVRLSPLSRRSHALAEAAALILGARDLGNHWWTQQHQSLTDDRQWVDGGVPDEVALANRHDDP